MRNLLPVLTVVAALLALWYAAAVWLNADWAYDRAQRAGTTLNFSALVADTWAQDKPKLPAPHQVATEIWHTTVEKKITSKRSLIYHSWVTMSATLLGFILGTALGIGLAIGIVYNRVMDMSVMPWVIASQTIPILAIAPMIIVVLNAVGISGLLPKAIISMYLSFFPVVVGMVKGLRSPDQMQLDQMRTWNASAAQTFWRLRLPMLLAPVLAAVAVGIAVSVGQYLPSLMIGGGRVSTLTTEAVALASGGDRRAIGVWALLQTALALAPFAVAVLLPGLWWRNRRGMRQG